MKLKQKLLMWAGLLFVCLAIGFLMSAHTNADPVGFTKPEISNSAGTYYIDGNDPSKIIGEFRRGGQKHSIVFSGPSNAPIGQYIPFVNGTGSFCEPPINRIPGPYRNPYDEASRIIVRFKSPTEAEIVSSDPGGRIHSYLWAGKNTQECGTVTQSSNTICSPAVPADVKCWPVTGIRQSSVTTQGGSPTGVGKDITEAVVRGATFAFDKNAGTIRMSFTKPDPKTGVKPGSIIFVDTDPYDDTFEFVSKTVFCSVGRVGASKAGRLTLNPPTDSTGKKNLDLSGSAIGLSFDIGYFSGSACEVDSKNLSDSMKSTVANRTISLEEGQVKIAQAVLTWDKADIYTLKCDLDSGECSPSTKMSKQDGSQLRYISSLTTACGGKTTLLGKAAPAYQGKYWDNGSDNCNNSQSGLRNVGILGKYLAPADDDGATPPPGTDTGVGPTANDCNEKSIGFALRWIFCPILNGASWLATTLTDTFTQQLSFTLEDTSTNDSNISAGGLSNLQRAWSAFRVIASSLLIILLLIMIISEAIGAGLDAYTVRKMLPRLIVAVILMQISWAMLVWIVSAVDALGRSLANIMYQPFGGSSQMDLVSLFNNAGISAYQGGAYAWVGLIGFVIAAAVAAPFILFMAIGAIVALLTGLLVLIFRKILIIAALLLAPIAFLAWILPGTQSYFKLWWSNLMKALFMFPIVVAIIAAGRIFAHIAAYNNSATFINFLIVCVGFFGPLFILPKTYRWGGSLMQATGNLTAKGTAGAYKPLKDYGEWRKGISRWKVARTTRRGVQERRAKVGYAQGISSGRLRYLRRLRNVGVQPIPVGGEGEIRRDMLRSAQQAMEEEQNKRAAEHIQPYVQAGAGQIRGPDGQMRTGFENLAHIARTGESHEREAAIGHLIKTRQWAHLANAGPQGQAPIATTADFARTLNKSGDAFGVVNDFRADLLPQNQARTAAQVFSGNYSPAGVPDLNNPGLSAGQLAGQNHLFYGRARADFTAMGATPDAIAALRGARQRIEQIARDPNSAKLIVGTPSEAHINAILAHHAATDPAAAGAPVTFRDLMP